MKPLRFSATRVWSGALVLSFSPIFACDKVLKKGAAEKLSHEVIETLNKVINVLAYVSDKGLFGEFYGKKLGRRLLFDIGASDDHERSIILKLRKQCGGQLTIKMEGTA